MRGLSTWLLASSQQGHFGLVGRFTWWLRLPAQVPQLHLVSDPGSGHTALVQCILRVNMTETLPIQGVGGCVYLRLRKWQGHILQGCIGW